MFNNGELYEKTFLEISLFETVDYIIEGNWGFWYLLKTRRRHHNDIITNSLKKSVTDWVRISVTATITYRKIASITGNEITRTAISIRAVITNSVIATVTKSLTARVTSSVKGKQFSIYFIKTLKAVAILRIFWRCKELRNDQRNG